VFGPCARRIGFEGPTGGSPDGAPDDEPDRSPDGEPDRSPDGEPDRSPDGEPDRSPDGEPDGEIDGADCDGTCGGRAFPGGVEPVGSVPIAIVTGSSPRVIAAISVATTIAALARANAATNRALRGGRREGSAQPGVGTVASMSEEDARARGCGDAEGVAPPALAAARSWASVRCRQSAGARWLVLPSAIQPAMR
jgi:hypothetical protein